MKALFATLAVISASFFPATAGEQLEPADFLADWPHLVGKRVTVTGSVYNATEESALLDIPPETIRLIGPWVDRSDLRYLFRHCIGSEFRGDACRMPVTGTVSSIMGRLELSAVAFGVPGK